MLFLCCYFIKVEKMKKNLDINVLITPTLLYIRITKWLVVILCSLLPLF